MTTEAETDKTDTEEHLSDLALDRLVTGEFVGDDLTVVTAHLDTCHACKGRERELRADRASFEASHLADEARVPRFEGGEGKVVSLASYRRGRVTRALAVVGTLAAAVLVFVVLPGSEEIEPPGLRTKGGLTLSFFVKDSAGVRAGTTGEAVFPGDQLRFVITTKAPGFAAVLSRDGAGTVSVYAADGPLMTPVQSGRHAFEGATELDGVLGDERLYGVVCSTSVRVATIEAAVRLNAEAPGVPSGCVVDVLRLSKRAR